MTTAAKAKAKADSEWSDIDETQRRKEERQEQQERARLAAQLKKQEAKYVDVCMDRLVWPLLRKVFIIDVNSKPSYYSYRALLEAEEASMEKKKPEKVKVWSAFLRLVCLHPQLTRAEIDHHAVRMMSSAVWNAYM